MVTFNKNYSNDEITVHWKPDVCIHSGNCARRLLSVFNPRLKPWININGAPTDEIVKAVEGCPSGALSWSKKGEHEDSHQ
ncbi:MAG: (4Fe-4S)-binding protein [Ignavibacteriales bacterium]|nr:(4Fe-4S)-binding protein [Ignavibacteriales bacterium]